GSLRSQDIHGRGISVSAATARKGGPDMSAKVILRLLAAGGLLLGLAGCSTKSPSEPSPTPGNPVPPTPVLTTTVSVSASPPSLAADATAAATVTLRVTRSDGAVPVNGTQVTLTTPIGAFGSVTGTNTTTLDLVNGQAQAFLFANGNAGIATLRATLNGTTT